MKRLPLLVLAALSLSSRDITAETASEVEAQKPTTLEPLTVSASRLDLSSDPQVDYIVPKQQIVFQYLGHDVPGNEIMQAEGLQDLKANWSPTYRSLDEFVSSISREGWKVAVKRDLKDFYVVVFATPQGNLAGEYYAKTSEGRRLQRSGKIQLFVSDSSYRQIVPDTDAFTLEQRLGYAVYVGAQIHGLMPANMDNGRSFVNPMGLSKFVGWLSFHQGDLFMMPSGIRHFLFVFRGGATHEDSVVLSFSNWSRSSSRSVQPTG